VTCTDSPLKCAAQFMRPFRLLGGVGDLVCKFAHNGMDVTCTTDNKGGLREVPGARVVEGRTTKVLHRVEAVGVFSKAYRSSLVLSPFFLLRRH
jgi:hypothetical protein